MQRWGWRWHSKSWELWCQLRNVKMGVEVALQILGRMVSCDFTIHKLKTFLPGFMFDSSPKPFWKLDFDSTAISNSSVEGKLDLFVPETEVKTLPAMGKLEWFGPDVGIKNRGVAVFEVGGCVAPLGCGLLFCQENIGGGATFPWGPGNRNFYLQLKVNCIAKCQVWLNIQL